MRLTEILQDIRYGGRVLVKKPLFTSITILTLALGIGANTAMFSVIDTVLLRPLAFKDSARLVIGRKSYDGGITTSGPISGYDWCDYRSQSRSFEYLAMMMWGPFRTTVTGGEEPERVNLLFVSWDLFQMLQVSPVVGRHFREDEAVVGGPPVIMLSYGYWQRRLGGDAGVVGKTLTAAGATFTVIGVMPADFRFLVDTDVWSLTYRDGPGANARRWHNLIVAGKLKPGVTIELAQQELNILSASLAEKYPDSNKGKSIKLVGLRDYMVEDSRTRSDLGFRPEQLLIAEIQIQQNNYPDRARQVAFFRALLDNVRSLPFVESATLVNQLPIRDPGNDIYAWPAGRPPTSAQDTRSAFDRVVFPGYFKTMGIPIRMGRDLAETDTADSTRVVVISSSMARDLFPGADPIGRTIVIDMGKKIEHQVIGVVEDVRMSSVRSDPYRTMYTSYLQRSGTRMRLAVRTSGDPLRLIPSVRQILQRLDRGVPLAEPDSMMAIIDRSISGFRIVTISLGLFSAIALLLTAVGLYGVLAFWVSQHLFEFGIRMALGATGMDTVGLIMKRGFLLVGIGLIPGIGASVLGTRIIRQLLFEVKPLDAASYVGASLFLISVTGLACLLPALRALRIDPAVALRAE